MKGWKISWVLAYLRLHFQGVIHNPSVLDVAALFTVLRYYRAYCKYTVRDMDHVDESHECVVRFRSHRHRISIKTIDVFRGWQGFSLMSKKVCAASFAWQAPQIRSHGQHLLPEIRCDRLCFANWANTWTLGHAEYVSCEELFFRHISSVDPSCYDQRIAMRDVYLECSTGDNVKSCSSSEITVNGRRCPRIRYVWIILAIDFYR